MRIEGMHAGIDCHDSPAAVDLIRPLQIAVQPVASRLPGRSHCTAKVLSSKGTSDVQAVKKDNTETCNADQLAVWLCLSSCALSGQCPFEADAIARNTVDTVIAVLAI